MPADRHHLALYAGSFDPITLGHLDVLGRARGIFDSLVLGIGDNPEKPALFSFEERIEMATQLVDEMVTTGPDGCPVQVKHYSGLTVDFAREVGAAAILRGIRNISDLAAETQLPSPTGRSPASRPSSSSPARTSRTPAPASSSRSLRWAGPLTGSPASFPLW